MATDQVGVRAPAYPAAVTIQGSGWRSPLAHDGRVPLVRPSVSIGRMEDNDIVLSDPLASRHHAVIRWTPQGYEVEDVGSVNGTLVDRLPIHHQSALVPGQRVQIGATEITLQPLAPQSGAAQAASVAAYGASAQAGPAAYAPTLASPPVNTTTAYPGGVAAPYPYPYPQRAAQANPVIRRLRAFLRKRWWKVFMIGLLAYIVAFQVLIHTDILNMAPLTLLLASSLVPVTFVIYCWEQNAFADMPASVVGLTFLSGAVLGLTLAGILEPLLIPSAASQGLNFFGALIVGICEETAKVIAVLWFLRDRRLRSELDGLILGAASGMGFAAFETAGYGFQSFLLGYTNVLLHSQSPDPFGQAIGVGLAQMNTALLLRMALAVFGHGVWTAILCAAIWRDRGQKTFRLTGGVMLAYAVAIGLHTLWDSVPSAALTSLLGLLGLLIILFWYLAVGVTGILILRFFIWESLERAKLGRLAPPLKPLPVAMARAFVGFFGFLGGGHNQPQLAYAAYAWGAPAPQQSPPQQPPYAPSPQPQSPQPQSPQDPPAMRVAGPQMQAGPTPMAPAAAVTCPHCGYSSPPGAQQCLRCGASLAPRP
ncbi:MAG: PrsW family glutamic-type intramembrane protease [Ktedonobacterales bacterium]